MASHAPNPMDKSWAKVRDKMPLFIGTAQKAGATTILPTSQSLLLSELSPKASGWCYGLTLAYLIGIKLGHSAASIIGNGFQAAAGVRNPGDEDEVKRLGQWTGRVKDYQSHGLSQYQTEEDFDDAGLKLVTWNKEFSDTFYRFTKVADYITGLGNGHYVIISSPNHAMAAITAPGKFSFYDPNFGVVEFATATNFKSFFVKWFDNDFLQRAYKGTTGGLKSAGPAKSLVLSLRTFK